MRKLYLVLFLLLVSLVCLGFRSQQRQMGIIGQEQPAAAALDKHETFETTGTCETWESNTGDPNHTTTPLSGSQELQLTNSGTETAVLAFTAADEVWVAFEHEIVLTPPLDFNATSIEILDSGDTTLCYISFRTEWDTVDKGDLRLYSNATSQTVEDAVTYNTENFYKLRYKKVAGANNDECELWLVTGGSWGSAIASRSDGTADTQPNKIKFSYTAEGDSYVDEVRVDTSDITTVDSDLSSCP